MDKQVVISFKELNGVDELSASDQELMQKAVRAAKDAYAPYSQFRVGAALLMENGEIITGNNQENAAYPLGLCAERVAFFSAGSHYPGMRIVACAITAQSDRFVIKQPVTPCGACRQAMSEYEENQQTPIRVLMMGAEGKVWEMNGVRSLLPLGFGRGDLEKH